MDEGYQNDIYYILKVLIIKRKNVKDCETMFSQSFDKSHTCLISRGECLFFQRLEHL